MARKPLRSQLNQIRAWVRQGRTDAWIAHQLEVSTTELREFRRRHELAPGTDGEEDLRDEIEAEIATMAEEEEEEEEQQEEESPAEAADEEPAQEAEPRRGRRRRRRRRGRRPETLEATFDHGETEGIGLWLDPSVKGDPVYSENWAGHRKVEVTIEPDQIVIKRSG